MVAALVLAGCTGAGPVVSGADHRPGQYEGTAHWICHPGLGAKDPCHPETEAVVDRSGRVSRRDVEAGTPGIDCFYVYGTVSTDPGDNSDLSPEDAEHATVHAQIARYSSQCRVFAPVYRQFTLKAIANGRWEDPAVQDAAYRDVVDAWHTYLARDNDGRGVVLVGHSQGARHLARLLRTEIDPDPAVRDRLVSAILMGTTIGVPHGKLVGGDLAHIPGCGAAEQTGCVISFASYAADKPPSVRARYGRDPRPGWQALCVNPTELTGGSADTVVTGGRWKTVERTPFVSLPDSFTARCTRTGVYTALTYAQADPADRRPLGGLLTETLGRAWGLHQLDAALAQDNLIEIVRRQAAAWRR